MDIKLEIFSWAVSDAIKEAMRYIYIDTNDVVNSVALAALNDIKFIINDENIEDDFDVVEEIVNVLQKYNIGIGGRHDF